MYFAASLIVSSPSYGTLLVNAADLHNLKASHQDTKHARPVKILFCPDLGNCPKIPKICRHQINREPAEGLQMTHSTPENQHKTDKSRTAAQSAKFAQFVIN